MMVIRPQGGVYFISGKMGLCECDAKGTVRVLNTNTGFYQLAINKDGKLWVSDLYGGVYSYDPTTAVLTLDSHVSIKEGDIVKGIVCDHDSLANELFTWIAYMALYRLRKLGANSSSSYPA